MRRLMRDAHLGKMAATPAGVAGVRIWHDQALIKQPWANPTGWRLDSPYWSFHSRSAISIWVALDNATLENDCLYFLPGAHKIASYDNVIMSEEQLVKLKVGDVLDAAAQDPLIDHSSRATLIA